MLIIMLNITKLFIGESGCNPYWGHDYKEKGKNLITLYFCNLQVSFFSCYKETKPVEGKAYNKSSI
jgi:hypothetical protein